MKNIILLHRDEPRIKTVDVYRLLGYNEHRSLKKVIHCNLEGFQKLGDIVHESFKPEVGSLGGRPNESYLINLHQFILLITLAKSTATNKEIRYKIIADVLNGFKNSSVFSVFELIKTMDVEDLDPNMYVYVVKESVSGRYKIGISKDPTRRVKELNVGNPEPLVLIHAYQARDAHYKSESLAHSLFSSHRLEREWFDSYIDLALLPSYAVAS